LAPFNQLDSKVPADVKAKLQELTQAVIDKKILVPERIKTTSDISATAKLGDQTYTITGISSGGKINSATINSGKSIKFEFDKAGDIELTLPKSVIDGITVVKAGDKTVEFQKISSSDSASTIKFVLPEGSSSVEISGTTVVPEFGTLVAIVLAAMLVGVVGIVRFKGALLGIGRL